MRYIVEKLKTIPKLFLKKKQTLFHFLPCTEVVKCQDGNKEIFTLYALGMFSAPDSFLVSHTPFSSEEIQENVELVELTPSSVYKPHYHKNSAAVIYIISGDGEFLLGSDRINYKPGTRIVIPAGKSHGFNTKTKTFFLSIQSPSIINQNQEVDLYYE